LDDLQRFRPAKLHHAHGSHPANLLSPIRRRPRAVRAVPAATPGDDVAMGDIDGNGLRTDAVDALREAGVGRGDLVAVAVAPGVGLGLAADSGALILPITVQDPASAVAEVERALQPRWVMWSSATAAVLTERGVRLSTAWDLVAVHRLIFGGWRADPA